MGINSDNRGHTRSGTDATMRTARCRKAFTLMELLVVITIIAIISTIAVGGYFGMMRAAAYTAAHDNLYNTISLARQRAVIDGKVTSVMILNATNYVVVRAVGRISHIDSGVTHDAYTDLSGAVTPAGQQVEIYNLDATGTKQGASRKIMIAATTLSLDDPIAPGSPFSVKGYRFTGAGGDFFAVGDRYGFALHSQQALPRGYRFTKAPQEVRFKNDGSCGEEKTENGPTDPNKPVITITVTENIRPENKIEVTVKASGEIGDTSTVRK